MDQKMLIVRTDRTYARSLHRSRRYLLAEVTAPPSAGSAAVRPPVNVAFVIDRSGSMASERKLGLAIEAVKEGIRRITPADRFSVVVFDDSVQVIVPSTAATGQAKADALQLLDTVRPGGGTALSEGWLRGAEQVAAALQNESVNRTILLTDGQANVGLTDPAALTGHAAQLRQRGVVTTTFGYGEGFDEQLLTAMSEAGGGAFRFIASPADIAPAIVREVGDLLEVTARGVELRIPGVAGVHATCLGAFATTPSDGGITIALGDLVADQLVRVVIEVELPLGEVGRETTVELQVAMRDAGVTASRTISWTFADDLTNDRQVRDREVDRAVARSYADQALRTVVGLNRERRFGETRMQLLRVADRIDGYAGDDPELHAIVDELRTGAVEWSSVRMEVDRKRMWEETHLRRSSRMAADGAPMRRRD